MIYSESCANQAAIVCKNIYEFYNTQDGLNALQIAASNGSVGVLEALIEADLGNGSVDKVKVCCYFICNRNIIVINKITSSSKILKYRKTPDLHRYEKQHPAI